MTYLPVGQLHSRAESLVAKFEQSLRGAGYIDSAIDLDCKALDFTRLITPSELSRWL